MTFTVDGEYIISGGEELGVWRAKDGKQIATMAAADVRCLAVSKNGRWIAGGTFNGHAILWDAKTFEKLFTHKEDDHIIYGVDFSPDSAQLVTASRNLTATVWDVAASEKVLNLHHKRPVIAAKFSPQGDRIATATRDSVRVWDSNDGRLLVDIPVKVTPLFNTGLLWSNSRLFVVSVNKIKVFKASTGSTVSEWPVRGSNSYSCIAIPRHGEFIAYSTYDTLTFWETPTHAQLGQIQHPQNIYSIARSPDDQFLAIGGYGKKITINSLSPITVSLLSHWIMVHLNNFSCSDHFSTGFNHFVSSTPHIPGTRYSYRRHCPSLLEAQPTRKRGGIIDYSNPRVSGSKS